MAINQGNFARAHDIGAGTEWLIRFRKTVGPGEGTANQEKP